MIRRWFVRVVAGFRGNAAPTPYQLHVAPGAPLEEFATIEKQLMQATDNAFSASRLLLLTSSGLALLAPAAPATSVVIAALCGAQLRTMPESFRLVKASREFAEAAAQRGRTGDLSPQTVQQYLLESRGNTGMILAVDYGLAVVAQTALQRVTGFEPTIELFMGPTAIGIWAAVAVGSLAVFPNGVAQRARERGLPTPNLNQSLALYGGIYAALGAAMVALTKVSA